MRLVVGGECPLFLDGLRLILADDPRAEVVAQVTSGDALLEVLEGQPADGALIDLAMCHLGGVPLLTTLRESFPEVRVLVLSHSSEPSYVMTLVELGVWALLPGNATTEELRNALSSITAGHLYVQGAMADALADGLGGPRRGGVAPLSSRQLEILQLAAEGLQNKQIARALGISESTVKNYLRDAYTQLDAGGRTDAIARALRLGLLD
jgi:two-component system response regulator DesR